MIGKFWKLQKSVCFCSLFDSDFFFPWRGEWERWDIIGRSSTNVAIFCYFPFRATICSPPGRFSPLLMSVCCVMCSSFTEEDCLVLLGFKTPPPSEESYFEFCVSTPPSLGRCASVLSPKSRTRFTPSLFENLSSFPSLASYVPSSNPNPNSGHLVHSSIWRIREKLLTFNPASSTFLPTS